MDISLLERLLQEAAWPRWRALIWAEVLALGLITAILVPLQVPAAWTLISLATTATAVVAAWLWTRRIPTFGRADVGILVCFYREGASRDIGRSGDILRALVNRLEQHATQVELPGTGTVQVKMLAAHHRVSNARAAGDLAHRTRALFVIWGSAYRGNVKGRSVVDMQRLNFLVRHRELPPDRRAGFEESLKLVHTPDRMYRIFDDNDAIDVETVASNLDIVAKYQIGLALAASGFLRQSEPFIREIARSGELPEFRRKSRLIMAELLTAKYERGMDLWINPSSDLEAVAQAAADAEEALRFDPTSVSAANLLANVLLVSGKPDQALQKLNQVKGILPRQSKGMYHVNVAAVHLAKGNFQRAIREYQRAHKAGLTDEMIESATRWLYAAVEKDPKWALGTAVMNDYWRDATVAFEEYETFLSQTAADPPVEQFIAARLRHLRSAEHALNFATPPPRP